MIRTGVRAQLEGQCEIDTVRRIDDFQDIGANFDNVTGIEFCIALRAAVDDDAGQGTGHDAYAVALLFDACMLEPGTPVTQMQDLVGSPAYGDDGRIDDFVGVLDAAGRVPGDESDQVFHGITSR